MKKKIMIMVDGFGIPPQGWKNSVYSKYCSQDFLQLLTDFAVPVDATMGVPGIPQSATGQTALFTGLNAAEFMQGHFQGFPGPKLRSLISEQNLFDSLLKRGYNVVFANAYVKYSLAELAKVGYRSVTTVMTEISLGMERKLADLIAGDAVYHDITRDSISELYSIEKVAPEKAAADLANLANKHDFTLFEYFMTDRAGHKRDENMLADALRDFSRFFCSLIGFAKDELAVIMTSDHGNCEDPNIKQHTLNPVPLFLYGMPMPKLGEVGSIEQIYHYILKSSPHLYQNQ